MLKFTADANCYAALAAGNSVSPSTGSVKKRPVKDEKFRHSSERSRRTMSRNKFQQLLTETADFKQRHQEVTEKLGELRLRQRVGHQTVRVTKLYIVLPVVDFKVKSIRINGMWKL